MTLRSIDRSCCAWVLCSVFVCALAACGDDDAVPPGDAGPVVDPCPTGYQLSSALVPLCEDLDECALGAEDCTAASATCTNTAGSFTCTCPVGFAGTGHGAGGCLAADPALTGLTVGGGLALNPAFSPDTTMYTVTLPRGAVLTTLIATVADPARTTITVDAAPVASGMSADVSTSVGPRAVEVVTATESGATRTYTVVLARGAAMYLKASNTDGSDGFGHVVSLSADGRWLAVGARHESSSAMGIDGDQTGNAASSSGAVYVFSWSGTAWAQAAYLKASNTGAGDLFGSTVSFSGDGTRLAVGASSEDSGAMGVGGDQTDNTAVGSGAVYVFARTGLTWAQEAYVKASNAGVGDAFGEVALSLSMNGMRLAVGARGEASAATGIDGDQADNTAGGSGAVYVFTRVGTTWSQEAYLKASNTAAGDNFGDAVSLSVDATRLAVGANSEDSSATGVGGDQSDNAAVNSGAAYVFTRTGTVWAQEAYLKASNTGAGDYFGDSGFSLAADGTRLAVAGVTEASSATGIGGDQTNNDAIDAGAVYIFARVGTTWTQEAYIKASNTRESAYFGFPMSFSADATRLAIGAYGDTSSATSIGGDQADTTAAYSGAVYMFSRSGTAWTQDVYVKATNTDARDTFGFALSLSADGARLVVGAEAEDSSATGIDGAQADNSVANSGAVYVY